MATRVVVDAMGSDSCPGPEVAGALRALRAGDLASRIHITLVGDRERMRLDPAEGLELVHTTEVVTANDHPAQVFRTKPRSSMRLAIQRVVDGQADAVVSAGHSGAMLAASIFLLGRIPGIERPAIVTAIPTPAGPVVLCDAGATVEPRPSMLAQFGVLGAAYARGMYGLVRPRVGLLSNGSEPTKGTELTRAALALLGEARGDFAFVGYVEGHDLFAGIVDVVATDGFTGNIVLKTCEGSALGSTYAEIGGALLAGVTRPVIIAHGRSDEVAIAQAIRGAARFASIPLISI
ncbi:MAG: phosphate acyltransferase [Proteobacteria bacterium]|nr:phosphate acyltransferase [Pseudomonadota bacterium]